MAINATKLRQNLRIDLSAEREVLKQLLCLVGFKGRADCRYITAEERQAFSAYDGLLSNPWDTVTLQVQGPNRTTVNRTVNIKDLAFCDPSEQGFRRQGYALLTEIVASGAFTRTKPSDNDIAAMRTLNLPGGQLRSGRLFSPERVVSMPTTYDADSRSTKPYGCNDDPRKLPGYWPIAQRFEKLYPTPRLFTTSGPGAIEADVLNTWLVRALASIHGVLKARNCNAAVHPALIAASAPPMPSELPIPGDTNDEYNRDVQAWFAAWRNEGKPRNSGLETWTVNGWFPPKASDNPVSSDFRFPGAGDDRWRASLATRNPLTFRGDPTRRGLRYDATNVQTTTYDAVLDLVNAVVALQAILDCGDYSRNTQGLLVDFHACSVVYNQLQRQAYAQIGQDYGTNFGAYISAIEEERNERARKYRQLVGRSFGGVGYAGEGGDEGMLAASLVGTLGIALAAGIAAGPVGVVVAVLATVAIGIYNLIAGKPPTETLPVDRQLLVSTDGPCAWHMTPREVLHAFPMLRTRAVR